MLLRTANPHLLARRAASSPSYYTPLVLARSYRPTSPHPACQKSCHSPNPNPTATATAAASSSLLTTEFWSSSSAWRRAGVNTTRCLIGCTLGDFSAMWYLQANHPELGIGWTMGIAMASGVTSSLTLETLLLRFGRDGLTLSQAFRTAWGMSIVSMLGMETAENLVDYHLMGGVVDLGDPKFWAAAVLSMMAGFMAPLPYNYVRLRKYGKACH